jgi:hypothetical protein
LIILKNIEASGPGQEGSRKQFSCIDEGIASLPVFMAPIYDLKVQPGYRHKDGPIRYKGLKRPRKAKENQRKPKTT